MHTPKESGSPSPSSGWCVYLMKGILSSGYWRHTQIMSRRTGSRNWSFLQLLHVDNYFSSLSFVPLVVHNLLWEGRTLPTSTMESKCLSTCWQSLKSKPSLPWRKREPVFWLLNVWAPDFNEPTFHCERKENRACYGSNKSVGQNPEERCGSRSSRWSWMGSWSFKIHPLNTQRRDGRELKTLSLWWWLVMTSLLWRHSRISPTIPRH